MKTNTTKSVPNPFICRKILFPAVGALFLVTQTGCVSFSKRLGITDSNDDSNCITICKNDDSNYVTISEMEFPSKSWKDISGKPTSIARAQSNIDIDQLGPQKQKEDEIRLCRQLKIS